MEKRTNIPEVKTSPVEKGERTTKLKDGRRLMLRRSRPEDRAALLLLGNTFSANTVYQIFFKSIHANSRTLLERYTDDDDPSRLTIVAQLEDEPLSDLNSAPIVGLAHFWRVASDTANMTLVVGDPWQGSGVGKALLTRLAEEARAEGIRRFYTFFAMDNLAMHTLLERCGLAARELHDNEGTWEISLP